MEHPVNLVWNKIDLKKLKFNVFEWFDDRWFLLSSGDFEKKDFNTMTISWGSMGIMWNKPFVQVVVRPTRYTYEFMNRSDYFTLSSFSDQYHRALNLLGVKSGRDGDKIAKSGLTPVKAPTVPPPVFAEADLIVECRKIYWDDFKPENFLAQEIHRNYSHNDYHRVFFGEIIGIYVSDK